MTAFVRCLRLGLWSALATFSLAPAALALCLDGVEAPLPVAVTFNSGVEVRILARNADQLRYLVRDPNRPDPMEMHVHAGLFTLQSMVSGTTITFDWAQDLPGIKALTVGASLEATAQRQTAGKPDSVFTTRAQVTGNAVVSVGGCDYPVLVIKVQNLDGGQDAGRVTKYLHLPSQITLKSTVQQGDKVTENLAVELK